MCLLLIMRRKSIKCPCLPDSQIIGFSWYICNGTFLRLKGLKNNLKTQNTAKLITCLIILLFLTNHLWVFLGKQNNVYSWVEVREELQRQRANQLYMMFWKTYNTITNLVVALVVVLGVETVCLAVRSDITPISQWY